MSVNFSYKYLAFLLTFHVLMFSAQSNGLIAEESPDNQHKKFLQQFTDTNITEKATLNTDSGIASASFFSPILAISGFINTIIGILVSPYSAIQGTGLPLVFKNLIIGLTGLTESYLAYRFVRGGA
jgi:hypothetical protein